MTVLGGGGGGSLLEAVVLSLDEMQFLLEHLQFDEMPVVLDAIGRYDHVSAHDAAMEAAEKLLTERELLFGDVVVPELAERLRVLYRPQWIIALRWVVAGQVNRFCLAQGDDRAVVALRGPDSYVIDDAGLDLPASVLQALGTTEALELYGMNAPTERLAPIFADTGDATATAQRLGEIGKPATDAATLASALVEIHSYAEIVGVAYGDGTREVQDNHIAVFNTRAGRFIITASVADDGVKWSSIATGTNARLRTAVADLIESLPIRTEFKATAPGA
ncbi:ESX secretion-associated protein EspG [Nocardia caishijiensis]|uniref:ESAT-6 protein secretion system EspG family protein n=1 Tax=Nocardia caishijiensis TaxID=184756 RepID=A0ABQ6YUX1_9NOCA|nr:ESX secretion-associated protein EspG [Nocardia caishijiensis]KAF0849615.1 ESAT-6 protein secretion system EspG family protein [Nocardia caishijiensis]